MGIGKAELWADGNTLKITKQLKETRALCKELEGTVSEHEDMIEELQAAVKDLVALSKHGLPVKPNPVPVEPAKPVPGPSLWDRIGAWFRQHDEPVGQVTRGEAVAAPQTDQPDAGPAEKSSFFTSTAGIGIICLGIVLLLILLCSILSHSS